MHAQDVMTTQVWTIETDASVREAASWPDALGDPTTRTGADIDGRVGFDWGVYGVPETFVVDERGMIRHKIIGAVKREKLEQELLPLVHPLQAQ